MNIDTKKRRRGRRGDGTVYQKHRKDCKRPVDASENSRCGCTWWIAYKHPDGRRVAESSESHRKGVAVALLQRRVGAKANNLAVLPNAEKLTFYEASQAVLDDYKMNKRKSLDCVTLKLNKHLMPYFGHRRLASIDSSSVTAYVVHRQRQGIERLRTVPTEDGGTERRVVRVGDVSNAELNRELALLKRTFSLAIRSKKIPTKPHIPMLEEDNVRRGFFEADQLESVIAHLPAEMQPVIRFAAITGWRIKSEVLKLEWRNVDFKGGEVRLDAGTTKNKKGRVFPFSRDLRTLLEARHTGHEQLRKAGHIQPRVFCRIVGGKPLPIKDFRKAWESACVAAGCPGRIPHDLRRTAVRNLVRLGVPTSVAMKLTGHKTESVFKRYDITSPADLLVAVERLDASPSANSSASAR